MAVADPPTPPLPRLARILTHPALRIGVPLLVAAIAFMVLRELAAHVRWADVRADLAAQDRASLLLAAGFTVLSFAGIAAYDVLAVRSVAARAVPARVAAATGAAGYAVSNVLGFSYVTGAAVRLRVYGAFGIDPGRLAGIFATAWFAFWLGLLAVFGALLLLHPAGISTMLPVAPWVDIAAGLALLAAVAGTIVWLGRAPRRLSLLGHGFALPSPGAAARLGAAAAVDMTGAALALYVLLPSDATGGLPYFLAVYVAAVALGVLSHAPGGIGVFEATVIASLGAAGRSDVLAALLIYRVIYYLLPFTVAVAGLAAAWAVQQRSHVAATAAGARRLVRPLVPPVAAAVTLIAGVILLVSGSLPADGTRLGLLRELVPLPFVEASHLLASVAGIFLVVVARGLHLRLSRAWLLAMALLAAGAAASLAKGLDWEEALSLIVAMAVLWLFRDAFYRTSAAPVLRLSGAWLATVVALMAAVLWIGFFAFSHVEYRDALWWRFAWGGDASRFLRASLAGAVVVAGLALNSVLAGRGPRIGPQPIPDAVRRLVAESEDAEANIALMGDKAFLVSDDGRAAIAYADTGGSLIAKGDPVGDEDAARRLAWEFRDLADRMHRRCAFYAVGPRFLPVFLDMGLSILKVGEVARVDLAAFTLDGSARKDFRHAKARAAREGYVFEVVPAAAVPPLLPELRGISDAWLAAKQGEEKGFALGAFDEAYLANFDMAVLRRGADGPVAAFANLFQAAHRAELSLDLMRYRPGGPSFVMDALFAELLLWGQAQGFRRFSLGAAPFAGFERHRTATLWNRLGGFVYEHGEALYHFEGLRAFKQKFDPVWTPNYLASEGGLAVPRVLYEVNVLISGGLSGLARKERRDG